MTLKPVLKRRRKFVNWTKTAQGRVQWRDLVNIVMNVWAL